MAKGAYIGVAEQQMSLASKAVGDIVKLNVSGSPVNFIVVHQGNPNSSMYDASCDGTWLACETKVGNDMNWTTSSGTRAYNGSLVDNYLNNTFFGMLDTGIQNVVKQVKIPYLDASTLAVKTKGNGLPRKVFALSAYELGATESDTSTYLPIDGTRLAYFTSQEKRNIQYNYWTRSPSDRSNYNTAWKVRNDGVVEMSNLSGSGHYNYARPALILPSTLAVDKDGNVTGETAGVVSVARKIKKGYVGIENLARKIKKAYIGIGGVARPCWSGGELAYYGTITPLSEVRSYGTAKSVGNYALFAGGFDANDGYTNKVDAYDESLTRTTPTGLKDGAYSLTSAKVGSYALFAGGSNNSTTYSSDVTSYNTGLTVSYPTSLSTGRSYPAGASVGNYALIAGGRTSSDYSTQVNSYNTSLTRSTATRLSEGRYMFAGTSVGNYAIFGGGLMKYYASSATVDAYNTSLTRTIPTKLSVSRGELAATTVGGYALFVGGGTAVDAYNTSLTRTALTSLNATQSTLGATTIKNYALFGGGSSSGDTTVYAYDESLTRTTFSLTVARYQSSATTVGNYALFGGGRNLDINLIDSVEAFTVA